MKNFEKFLSLKEKNYGKYRIVKELNVTMRTYYNYMAKVKNGIRSSPKKGRRPKLSVETKTYIRNLVKRCKFITTKQIYDKCQKLNKISSIGTITKYLNSIKYFHYKEKKAPLISQKNKSKRMQFCINYYNFDYTRVICVDECHFINVPLCTNRFWSKNKGRKRIGVSKKRMDVSVFGAISYKRKYPLKFYSGRLNSRRYRDILVEYFEKFERMENDVFFLQQDNAPCHVGKSNKAFFNDLGIKFLNHPPASPDLNSIEHVWGEIKKKVLTHTYTNEESLKKEIKKQWRKYSIKKFRSVQKKWNKRLAYVIKAKGGNGYN